MYYWLYVSLSALALICSIILFTTGNIIVTVITSGIALVLGIIALVIAIRDIINVY